MRGKKRQRRRESRAGGSGGLEKGKKRKVREGAGRENKEGVIQVCPLGQTSTVFMSAAME